MTDLLDRSTDANAHESNPQNGHGYAHAHAHAHAQDHDLNDIDKSTDDGGGSPSGGDFTEIYSDDSTGLKSSDSSSSGSWSIDDSIEFLQTSHNKPMFDELPTYSIRSLSPTGRSMSPIINEPISLFNLSISPISSLEDLTRMEQSMLGNLHTNDVSCGKFAKDLLPAGEELYVSSYDDDERISLDEITASISTPPSMLPQSRGSQKRLNLETIFEGVFLDTPPKKRKFDSRRTAHKFHEITSERISSYVIEQQQHRHHEQEQQQQQQHQEQQIHSIRISTDSTTGLCNTFDDKINLNN